MFRRRKILQCKFEGSGTAFLIRLLGRIGPDLPSTVVRNLFRFLAPYTLARWA